MASLVTELGYKNCIELSNDKVRVVLDPNVGGRVLIYERSGKDILYHDPALAGQIYEPFGDDKMPWFGPEAGRFDVGPEKAMPERKTLWAGTWEGEITGQLYARMFSKVCPDTHLQLIREFELDNNSSKLICKQTIKNSGEKQVRVNHWSRTLAKGNGILIAPIDSDSRFPEGFIVYSPDETMDFEPLNEPGVRVRNGYLEIFSAPDRPKFVFDVDPGWLAYITDQNQIFIKKFDPHIGRMSGEMAAVNASVWYYKDLMCEIEPIGPMEILDPGSCASFIEDWWLEPFDFPADRKVDLEKIEKIISGLD